MPPPVQKAAFAVHASKIRDETDNAVEEDMNRAACELRQQMIAEDGS